MLLQVERVYHSIALGCLRADSGVVETNIGRDIRDRKKMGTFPYRSSRCILLTRTSHTSLEVPARQCMQTSLRGLRQSR